MAQIDNIINVNSVWNSTTILPILESVTLKMWIYSGTQGNTAIEGVALDVSNDRTAATTYTLKGSSVKSGTDKAVSFDLAPLIKDYIESELEDTKNSNNAMWVDIQLTKTVSGVETILASEHYLAVDGYDCTEPVPLGETSEGVQQGDIIRMSNRTILNPDGERVSIPLLRTGVLSYIMSIGVVDVESIAVLESELSNEQIIYVSSPVGQEIDLIRITYDNLQEDRIHVSNICQDKYQDTKLTFVNKQGAFQDVWFFANKRRTLSVKSDTWNRRNKLVGGGAYRPTTVKNIESVNETHTINSGFYPENNNVVFEELMQSNNVWVTENGRTLPIIIKSSGFNFKDSNTDKAINYTISFEYAFNKMRSL